MIAVVAAGMMMNDNHHYGCNSLLDYILKVVDRQIKYFHKYKAPLDVFHD